MENLYHERQSLALCAVHAVNNLLQRKHYSKEDFDQLCLQMDSSRLWNAHRSPLGIGNYDVNVAIQALQMANCTTDWQDARKELELTGAAGILWNVPGWLWGSRHWIALLRVNQVWLNLDSKLKVPKVVGDDAECAKLLKGLKGHVILVQQPDQTNEEQGAS